MLVIDEVVQARSSLVAPQRLCSIGEDVWKGAVEELEQFVPLACVVLPRLVAAEAHSIVVNMLEEEEDRTGAEITKEH